MAIRDEIKAFVKDAPAAVLAVPTPELPQWDGQIFVTRVSPRALATHWKDTEEEDALDERAAFVVLVTSDKDGSRIFQDEDVLWLSTTPLLMSLVERLYWAGRQHNGLTEENRTAWRKNLVGTGCGGGECEKSPLCQMSIPYIFLKYLCQRGDWFLYLHMRCIYLTDILTP